ncbi:MAG: aminotransferase class IV [Ferruginibacter sp.]
MPQIVYNGKILDAATPLVTAASRALRYGDGIFETIKMTGGRLRFARQHFDRLWLGMHLLGIECPAHLTPARLEAFILQLAEKNGLEGRSRIRINIFRGEGGLFDPITNQGQYIIEAMPLPATAGEMNQNGLVLGIYHGLTKPTGPISNLKHNNCLPYILGAREAGRQHWNDAIILNPEGRVCETTIANIFCIKNNCIFTPALGEGCVAGITRQLLLDHLPGLGWETTEQPVTPEMLLDADEVLLTNSIHEIRWVKEIENRNYSNAICSKIYQALMPTISAG